MRRTTFTFVEVLMRYNGIQQLALRRSICAASKSAKIQGPVVSFHGSTKRRGSAGHRGFQTSDAEWMLSSTQTDSRHLVIDRLHFQRTPEGVVTFRLINARKANPLSLEMMQAMLDELNKIEQESDEDSSRPNCEAVFKPVRVIVFKHDGAFFSSGHDLADLFNKSKNWDQRGQQQIEKVFQICSQLNKKLLHMPQPTVAVVNGHAMAGGVQLVASCDIVVASESATFSAPGSQRGRFCHTPAVALCQRMQPKKVLEMLLLGTELSASQALSLGLVTMVIQKDDDIVCAGSDEATAAERLVANKNVQISAEEHAVQQVAFEQKVQTQVIDKLMKLSKTAIQDGKVGFFKTRTGCGAGTAESYLKRLEKEYELAEKCMVACFLTKDAAEGTKHVKE